MIVSTARGSHAPRTRCTPLRASPRAHATRRQRRGFACAPTDRPLPANSRGRSRSLRSLAAPDLRSAPAAPTLAFAAALLPAPRGRAAPAPGSARALKQKGRLAPPARAPHCAKQTQPVRTRPGARHPTRSRAARSRQEARLPSLDTHSNHPLRTSPTARAPRRLRPPALPANHRFASRLTLALARRRRAAPPPGNRTAACAARARFALREAGTAGPPGAARRSAPHAKPRGAVTPRGETSLARYNNHRCTHRYRWRSATAPAYGLA